jgi:hypothetical protein
VVYALPITLLGLFNLQMKALQSFETLGTIYPVENHDTPEDQRLLK